MSATLPSDDAGPVFVVGHPRSGTTFLQLLLLTHPAFTSAPETHFFTYVLDPYARRVPLEWLGHKDHGPKVDDPLKTVFARLAAKPGITLDAPAQDRIRRTVGPAMDPSRLLGAIMHELAESGHESAPGSSRWIEKTPRHAYFVRDILELFPNARILHLIRDPRAVVSSPKRFSKLTPDSRERREYIVHRCASWQRVLHAVTSAVPNGVPRVARAAGDGADADPTCRVLSLQYEHLAADVPSALSPVFRWLGVDPRDADAERFSEGYSRVTTAGEEGRKGLTSTGRVVNRSSVWRERLTDAEAALIESRCGETMRILGYAPGSEIVDPATK